MSRRSSVGEQSHYSSLGKSQRSESYEKYSNPRPSSRNSQRNVLCDFCLVKKMKAVKSCLTCLTSFCETHLQAHYEYPALMKHKLVPATGQLKEKICAEHDKLLEVFCRSDQTCVCVLCLMDEHKKHDIASAAAERTEKQKQLSVKLMSSQQKIDERVKKWQDLMQATESLKHSSQSVLEENERIFTELMQAVERRYGDVKEMIRAQETALMVQAERHLSQMEEEITLLKMKHNDLERLSHSEDHIHFLKSWQSLSAPSGYEDLSKVSLAPFYSFDKVKKAISEFKVEVEDVSKREVNNISCAAKEVQILQILEPKTRDEFLQYYCQLSLDPLTAHPNLYLSEGNTVVQMSSETNSYPEHPERFNYWQQVMCREAMTGGRYYWEIEWSGTEVDIAVSQKEISRKGNDNVCSFGWNDKSYSLYCSESKYSFMHQSKRSSIPVPNFSRIGVYLDHKSATLAFYSISDTMTLLHKINTSFTQPLYAGFGVWGYGSTVKIL